MEILSSIDSLKYFKSMPTEPQIIDILSDIKHRIFPRPFERLSSLRGHSDLVGAEIGVCGGEHAVSLLTTLNIKRLYLIDPYTMYEDYSEGALHYGVEQCKLSDTEISAKNLLEPFKEKIVWIRELSSKAVNQINEPLDFVYIDGNHAYPYVKDDLDQYSKLLKRHQKQKSVIGGHDFYNGFQKEHDGVLKAVTEYSIANSLNLNIELPDWWIEI